MFWHWQKLRLLPSQLPNKQDRSPQPNASSQLLKVQSMWPLQWYTMKRSFHSHDHSKLGWQSGCFRRRQLQLLQEAALSLWAIVTQISAKQSRPTNTKQLLKGIAFQAYPFPIRGSKISVTINTKQELSHIAKAAKCYQSHQFLNERKKLLPQQRTKRSMSHSSCDSH